MKKFIVLSALVAAASTAFVACSSDDDLAQQPKAPETTVEEGTPLKIKVVDATRGTDWTAATLPSISLYSIANGGTTRGFGTYNEGSSVGQFFQNDGSGNFSSGSTDGTTFTPSDVYWSDGTWDFYALSNKDNVSTFEFAKGAGDVDAEHLNVYTPVTYAQSEIDADAPTYYDADDEAAGTIPAGKSIGDLKTPAGPAYGKTTSDVKTVSRNFSYTVPTDYNESTDLLVAEATGLTKASGDVDLPFYHALAQIGQITLNFADLGVDNSSNFFVIKSITIHGLKGTGTYTFPAEWNNTTYNYGTWTPLVGSEPAEGYHVELPQFELDAHDNYNIFAETDDSGDDWFENESSGFATGTKRGGITGLPNYFQAPASGSASYVLPLAKKTGTEGAQQATPYVITGAKYTTTPTSPAYDVDGGLYIIPQPLAKTVWAKNGSGDVTGVASGVYAEIRGIMINLPNLSKWSSLDENIVGASSELGNESSWLWNFTNVNNAEITQILNHEDYVGSYLVPLVSAKKELKAGKRYNLTFELSQAVTIESGACVFDGADIE